MTGRQFRRGMTVAVCGLLAGVHANGGETHASSSQRPLPHLDWHPSPGPALGSSPGSSEDPKSSMGANRIMTDTLEYCAHLAAMYEMVRQSGEPADPVDDVMAREGLAMCRHGEVRTGVHALRRALVGFGPPP